MLAAGMLFAACSSDKDVAENDNSHQETPTDGFMSVKINLPTTPQSVSRAANDNFSDGLAAEYKVHDCALLLFQGTSESTATLMNAQAILLPFDANDSGTADDDITTSYQATASVSGFSKTTGNKLYALAVLNYKNVMSIAAGVPTIAGTTLTPATSKLSDVRTLTTNVDLISHGGTQNYFFMTNAVLSSAQGGGVATAPATGDVFQLAELDPTKIYPTEAEAKLNPAGDIVVERAVAKATLKLTATTVQSETPALAIASSTWAIDNMEPTSYVTRNPGDLSYIGLTSDLYTPTYYRFVGNTTTKNKTSLGTTADSYRTYWCVDPQYDTDATGLTAATSYIATGATPLYCYENTFDVQRQSYQNTTRAIIKVTLSDTEEFWTVNGSQIRYKTVADATSYVVANIVGNTTVLSAFESGLNSGKSYTVNASSFAITYERDANGQYAVKTLDLSDAVKAEIGTGKTFKASFATDIAPVLAAAITTANSEVVVLDYKNGEMWYEARFQHFASSTTAEDLAPWNVGETPAPSGGSTSAAYPSYSAARYLGRYGMVRNNWYDVDVTAFKKLGEPVDISGNVKKPSTPDDNLEEYISAKIHILSWAKRTQSWSF